jgi:hypothetical protein
VNAARELREWRVLDVETVRGDEWLALLTPRERGIVRRLIERALTRAGQPITPQH